MPGRMNSVEYRTLKALELGKAKDVDLHTLSGSNGHPLHYMDRLFRHGMVRKTKNQKIAITERGRDALKQYEECRHYIF